MPRRYVRRAAERAARIRDIARATGAFATADRSPSGRVSGVVVGVTGPKGGMAGDPATVISYRIRAALDPRVSYAPVTVTDAAGRVIATVDPLTRVRATSSPWEERFP